MRRMSRSVLLVLLDVLVVFIADGTCTRGERRDRVEDVYGGGIFDSVRSESLVQSLYSIEFTVCLSW